MVRFLLLASLLLTGYAKAADDLDRSNLRPVSGQAAAFPELAPDVPGSHQDNTALIELDGTLSENPDGGELSYSWRQIEGPKVELSDPAAAKPYFRTGKAGFYRFELIVTANGMSSEPFYVDLEIERQNLPPIAKAPREVRGMVGKMLEIDAGESFDPEGENLTYRWRPLTRGLELPQSVLNKPTLTFEPTLDGVFEVELVVSDGETVSQPLIVSLYVKPKPRPPVAKGTVVALKIPTAPQPEVMSMAPAAGAKPVATISGPAAAQLGETVTLDARGSRSAETSRLEYLWRQKSGAFISDFELVFDGGVQRFKAPREGDYEFELVVSDGKMESDPIYHKVRILKEPDPPVAVVVAPARAMPGALVKMDATQSYDMQGSPLIFRWRQTGGPKVTNYVIDEKIGDAAPAFHPPTAGVYSFELVVSNGKLQSKPVEIDIEVGDARRPPALSIGGPDVANAGDRLEFLAVCDQPNLAFAWRQVEGPASALPAQSDGIRVTVVPPSPGRYVFDLAALDNGKVVSTARRTLEVFGTGQGRQEPIRAAGHPQPTAAASIRQSSPMPSTRPAAPAPVSGAGRPAAQIHPSSLQGGLYPFDTQDALEPLAPLPALP